MALTNDYSRLLTPPQDGHIGILVDVGIRRRIGRPLDVVPDMCESGAVAIWEGRTGKSRRVDMGMEDGEAMYKTDRCYWVCCRH